MANIRGKRLTAILVLALSFSLVEVECHRGLATPIVVGDSGVYDVTEFGAKGDGKAVYRNGESMNGLAMMKAWQKACHCSTGPSKVVIPKGSFVVAQVIFAGPCKNPVTVELQGSLVADPDVSQFPNHEFLVFENVEGVTFTGSGTLDVSNQVPKSSDPYKNDVQFVDLMPTIKLCKAKNVVVEGITSVNPASYHVFVVESEKIDIHDVNFSVNYEESNSRSKGIYISASCLVNVSNSYIKTKDNCVTVAPGSNGISLTGLTCEAGQGISVGSKPFTASASASLDIKGVIVKNCVFKGSKFGARIIPHLEAKASLVSNIQLEDLVMDGVQNPIVINQNQVNLDALIQAKITNVLINNIKGTTTTRNPLSFLCSLASPCEGIQVGDIDLSFIHNALFRKIDIDQTIGNAINGKGVSSLIDCLNAKVLFNGKNDGLSCNLLH